MASKHDEEEGVTETPDDPATPAASGASPEEIGEVPSPSERTDEVSLPDDDNMLDAIRNFHRFGCWQNWEELSEIGIPPLLFDSEDPTAVKPWLDGFNYKNVDLNGIMDDMEASYKKAGLSRESIKYDLKMVSALTYKRGCNPEKVFIRWANKTYYSKFFKSFAQLKIVSPKVAGKRSLTLGRLAMVRPQTHILLRFRGLAAAINTHFNSIPVVCHTPNLATLLTKEYDGCFYAVVLYSIYLDTVVNRKFNNICSHIAAHLEEARDENTLFKTATKVEFLEKIEVTEEVNRKLGWCQPLYESVKNLTTKDAFLIIEPPLMNNPAIESRKLVLK